MRRILPVLLALLIAAVPAAAQSTKTSRSGLKYHFMGSPEGGRKPLIIFLHGTGGGAMVWNGWARAATNKGYLAVLPYSTGTGKNDPKSGNRNGDNQKRWAEVDLPKLVDLAREMQETQGADPRRTFIAGYSNGGFYAMETGLRHPDVFSAVLCVGGGCNVWKFSDPAKRVGVYIIHGTNDRSVKFETGKKAADRLTKEGFDDVVFRKYDGRGHELFEEEIPKFFPWLKKQRLSVVPGADDSIPWKSDLEAALEEAKKADKKVLVYAYSAKDADSEVAFFLEMSLFRHERFAEVASKFVCVKVDLEEISTDLELKGTQLAVVEWVKDEPKVTGSVRSPGRAETVLRGLEKGKVRSRGGRRSGGGGKSGFGRQR